jgi:hypothetical protein
MTLRLARQNPLYFDVPSSLPEKVVWVTLRDEVPRLDSAIKRWRAIQG